MCETFCCIWEFLRNVFLSHKRGICRTMIYHCSPCAVCGGFPVHLWDGWEGLSPESHLRDARVPPPWLRPCRRAHQHLPHVRVKIDSLIIHFQSSARVDHLTRAGWRSTSMQRRRGRGRENASSLSATAPSLSSRQANTRRRQTEDRRKDRR